MKEKTITCTVCPMGCRITVREETDALEIAGHACERGEAYARSEYVQSVRILTSTVLVVNAEVPLMPVRSDKPLPRELLGQCMDVISTVKIKAPVGRYDIVVPNILGTGINIVATGEV